MTRIPSLDGWRAISIVIVMVGHVEFATGFPANVFPWWGRVFQGDLGVRIFFVISGFLITYLLVAEGDRTGRPSLKQFYARRALRIFPVYYLFAAVLMALAAAGLHSDTWSTWIGTFTVTRDFIGRGDSVTVHLWSLAVEEQFYLVWPMTLVTFALWRRTSLASAVLLVPVVVSPIVRTGIIQMHYGPGPMSRLLGGFSIALYADSLAIGCLGAFIYRRHHERLRVFASPLLLFAAVCGVGLAAAWQEGWMVAGRWGTTTAYAVGPSIQAALIMTAIWVTIERRTGAWYRVLNAPPVVWLGILSYSLYIWQQLFLGHFAGPRLSAFPLYDWRVWWIPALAAAVASYYAVERPILRLRERFRAA